MSVSNNVNIVSVFDVKSCVVESFEEFSARYATSSTRAKLKN
jgi:hypothetical protein